MLFGGGGVSTNFWRVMCLYTLISGGSCVSATNMFNTISYKTNISPRYRNNEYIPLLEPLDLDGAETPCWLLLPPPGLHTVLLGPVNQVIVSVKEYFEKQSQEECIFAIFNDDLEEDTENPVDLYMRKVNIQRSQYFNKKLEGNECQKFIKEKNLKIFSKILEESSMPTHIQVKVVKVLDPVINEIIQINTEITIIRTGL